MITKLTIEEFKELAKKQGATGFMNTLMVCPRCQTVQCGNDLKKALPDADEETINGYLGFSCIGRFDQSKGCNWTLGGLFMIHDWEIVTVDGNRPIFRIADLEEVKRYKQ